MRNSFEVKATRAFYKHDLVVRSAKIKNIKAARLQMFQEGVLQTNALSNIIKKDEERLLNNDNKYSLKDLTDVIFINKNELEKLTALYASKVKQFDSEIENETETLISQEKFLEEMDIIVKESENHYGR